MNIGGCSDEVREIDISVRDDPVGFDGAIQLQPVPLISNADTGVVFTWEWGSGGRVEEHMTITSGITATNVSGPVLPGQQDSVGPVLQAQDGSFVGLALVGADGSPPASWVPYMVAFDQTGAVRWTVANEQPQIATVDGGVIGQSGTIYDQSGGATWQLTIPGKYSWIGAWYATSGPGAIQATVFPAIALADSYMAFLQGNASQNGTANKPVNKDVQQLIAQIARSYVGSQNWLDTQGSNKCNLFVHDVLKQAGLNPPTSPTAIPTTRRRIQYYLGLVDSLAYPALAADWANPKTVLQCWRPVTVGPPPVGFVGPQLPPGTLAPDISIPGDVIAEPIRYIDATGHVGIIVGTQQTVSADSAASCFPPYAPAGTIDISDYGFRPDSWVDPYGCRGHGLNSKAAVKRFVCQ